MAIIGGGQTLQISAGQTSNGLVVQRSGTIDIRSGGTVIDTTLSGGSEIVFAGGNSSLTTIDGGGVETVMSGGTASGTLVGADTAAALITPLHYAPNANEAFGSYNAPGDPGSDGFNLADVSSVAEADALPAGVKGLIWLGDTSGLTTAFMNTVDAAANDPKVFGFYVADEPADSAIPNLAIEDAYIALHAPGKVSFIVAEDDGTPQNPFYAITPANTGADLIGLDPYPVRPQFTGGMDLGVIDAAVQEAVQVGWSVSQIVPVYQAFGGGDYLQLDAADRRPGAADPGRMGQADAATGVRLRLQLGNPEQQLRPRQHASPPSRLRSAQRPRPRGCEAVGLWSCNFGPGRQRQHAGRRKRRHRERRHDQQRRLRAGAERRHRERHDRAVGRRAASVLRRPCQRCDAERRQQGVRVRGRRGERHGDRQRRLGIRLRLGERGRGGQRRLRAGAERRHRERHDRAVGRRAASVLRRPCRRHDAERRERVRVRGRRGERHGDRQRRLGIRLRLGERGRGEQRRLRAGAERRHGERHDRAVGRRAATCPPAAMPTARC